jgi:alpha-L-rhamnosidase
MQESKRKTENQKLIPAIVFGLMTIFFWCCHKQARPELISVGNLRCEQMADPQGIDIREPLLSWQIHSEQRDIQQTAYQILVADSPEQLNADKGNIWNSGKVESGHSINIPYDGKKLKSRMSCYWKVKVWSKNGESKWSKSARWSMGPLYYKDWSGRWIGFDRAFPWDKVEKFSRLSARYFRKEFELDPQKEIKSATAYIIGLGLYQLYINGEKAGDQVLSPAPTDFTKNVKYNTFDITDKLQKGKNAIGTILGNGRFFAMRQNYKPYKIKTFGFPKMLFNLIIEYSDGTKKVIKTDNSWMGTANGPIVSNNEYDGEDYDARKEMPGWSQTGFDDSNWIPAEYVQEPGGEYEAQMNENMKVMKNIVPVSIIKKGDRRYIIDFGQNMAGWLRIKVQGKQGDLVTIRYAESLDKNGELFTAPLRDAMATDRYTLKGSAVETWEPAFIYHGFRYAEVSGYPGIPLEDDFTGRVVYDNMETTGSFESSDTLLNKIFHNAFWSIISTYKGMPIDCPQRNERMPWLGDRAIGCYGESFVVDNCNLYTKWLDDIQYSQKADGCISDVAPAYFRYYSDNMTWPGTYLMVAEMLYKQYGLEGPIRKHYASMKLWMDYMKNRHLVDGIMTKDSYGDWCRPPKTIEEGRCKSADVKRPSQLISTAYYYYYLNLMQQFAHISDNDKDAHKYKKKAKEVKKAFNATYFHADSGYYGEKTLTENLLPLAFDIVPDSNRSALKHQVEQIILKDNAGHLSVGLVGAQWLMRSLSDNGMEEIAYKLATNNSYPSWGYMVKNGATTIWELWNANTAAPNMNSQNHVMLLGDLIIWYYEHLAGIRSDIDNPGFKKIIMKPDFPDRLSFVNAAFKSVYGTISSSWKQDNNLLRWTVTIPPNTHALVYLPTGNTDSVTESGKPIKKTSGIKSVEKTDNSVVLNVGSGTYNFEINQKKI